MYWKFIQSVAYIENKAVEDDEEKDWYFVTLETFRYHWRNAALNAVFRHVVTENIVFVN